MYNPNSLACLIESQYLAYLILIVCLVHVIPTIILFVSFISICVIVHKQRNFIKRHLPNSDLNTNINQTKETRTLTTLLIITCGFYIMWLPFFITGPYREILIEGNAYHSKATFFTCLLGGANSMINPIVYIPTLRPYRQRLIRLLHCKRIKKRFNNTAKSRHTFTELHDNMRCRIERNNA